jgi:FxLD family lantipeptide
MNMPPSTINGAVLDRTVPAQPDVFGEFELDVQVTTDAAAGYTVRRCDTSDGCAATCASSCASS